MFTRTRISYSIHLTTSRWDGRTDTRRWLKQELLRHPQLVLMCDFNITTDAADVWDRIGLEGTIHCTDEERYELEAIKALGLVDTHRMFPQAPKSFWWWDYRNMAFRRKQGLRIDYVLTSQALAPKASACLIDVTPRKNERPSYHAPVVLTLAD